MGKKKKRRIQAPSLSSVDKCIYYFLMACAIAFAFLSTFFIGIFKKAVFQNTHILAQNSIGIVPQGFLGLAVGCVLILLLNYLRINKQPFWGKPNTQYGPPQWKPIYPLFSIAFWTGFFSNKKRASYILAAWIFFLLIILAVTCLTIAPRECLHDDGSVLIYNAFNENTAAYHPADIVQIKIFTREFHNRRGSDDWGVEMKITTQDGESFFFNYHSFQRTNTDIHGAIFGMLQIKSGFDPSRITLEGKENLEYVIRDMNLNQQEADMLNLLFDVT